LAQAVSLCLADSNSISNSNGDSNGNSNSCMYA